MKRWLSLVLTLTLCFSLGACASEKECENCAKLEKEIEKLENKIDKLEDKLDVYEPGGDGGLFDSTAPEINHTSTFTSWDSESVTIALQGAAPEGFDRFLSVSRSAELKPYPSKLNTDPSDNNTLITDSLLCIPVYGADGRVQELVANTVSGTYDPDQNAYIANDDRGFRVVGPATDGVITDEYAYIFDLSFRTKASFQSIFYDGGYFLIPAEHSEAEDLLEVYGQCLLLIFYDTASGEMLGVAVPDSSEAALTRDEKSYHVPLVYLSAYDNSSYLTDLDWDEDRNISILLWLDGSYLENEWVIMGTTGISGIHLLFNTAP